MGRHDVPHRAARRHATSARRSTTATQQRRRQLHDPRHEDLHLRRRPRPRREHHPPGARARRRRAAGHQGPHALHRAEAPHQRRRHARRARTTSPSARIEHKMGINGSATCVLNFGENGNCIGELVGGDAKLNQGMPQMFQLMNERAHRRRRPGPRGRVERVPQRARLREGAQAGRERSSTGRTPTAPRVPIIEHADVRRMLLDMKARVEGIRALAVKLTMHQDQVDVARGQGRREGRLPPGPGRPARAARQGLRLRPGVPRLRDRDPDLRRRRLHAGLPGRAVLPRREDLLDLRGHEPHPGDGPRRPQAGQAGGANLQAFLGDVGEVRRRATRRTRRSAPR